MLNQKQTIQVGRRNPLQFAYLWHCIESSH